MSDSVDEARQRALESALARVVELEGEVAEADRRARNASEAADRARAQAVAASVEAGSMRQQVESLSALASEAQALKSETKHLRETVRHLEAARKADSRVTDLANMVRTWAVACLRIHTSYSTAIVRVLGPTQQALAIGEEQQRALKGASKGEGWGLLEDEKLFRTTPAYEKVQRIINRGPVDLIKAPATLSLPPPSGNVQFMEDPYKVGRRA